VTQYTKFTVAFFTFKCHTVSQHTCPCNCTTVRPKTTAFGTHKYSKALRGDHSYRISPKSARKYGQYR
jgi:hypothetical protein